MSTDGMFNAEKLACEKECSLNFVHTVTVAVFSRLTMLTADQSTVDWHRQTVHCS